MVRIKAGNRLTTYRAARSALSAFGSHLFPSSRNSEEIASIRGKRVPLKALSTYRPRSTSSCAYGSMGRETGASAFTLISALEKTTLCRLIAALPVDPLTLVLLPLEKLSTPCAPGLRGRACAAVGDRSLERREPVASTRPWSRATSAFCVERIAPRP